MRTVKNYVGIILCACVIIFIYKTFDISLFSNILSAFIPLIVGAILAYFLQPLVYKFEMFLDSFQNKKLIKYSHTISSIFVFVVFVLIIVGCFRIFVICRKRFAWSEYKHAGIRYAYFAYRYPCAFIGAQAAQEVWETSGLRGP